MTRIMVDRRAQQSVVELESRRDAIIQRALGIDYSAFVEGPIVLDYESLMASTGFTGDEVRSIQQDRGVGGTPMLECCVGSRRWFDATAELAMVPGSSSKTRSRQSIGQLQRSTSRIVCGGSLGPWLRRDRRRDQRKLRRCGGQPGSDERSPRHRHSGGVRQPVARPAEIIEKARSVRPSVRRFSRRP